MALYALFFGGAAAGLGLGLLLGSLLGSARARARGLEALRGAEAAQAAERAARAVVETELSQTRARLDEERARLEEQGELLATAEARLGHTFRALAAEALQANNQGFLTLAAERLEATKRASEAELAARQAAIEGIVGPVKASLDRVDGKIQELERERGLAFGRLMEQVRSLATAHDKLEAQAGNLARALQAPTVRGRWGEMQLRRVVELAGMVEHCDFVTQATLIGDDRRMRPDLVVRLPGGRHLVVDAKAPLDAYLAAHEAADEGVRRARLAEHASQVRAHLVRLGAKSYWADAGCTPEFVVMFLPSEAIYSAALQETPGLIEEGVGRRVLLATPTTLIALLQAVHYGWRQERVAEEAAVIAEHGRLLHDRIATLVEHWARLGGALGKATEHFNAAAASFEGRVLPALRRLEELGAGGRKGIEGLARVDTRPRELVGEEKQAALGSGGGQAPALQARRGLEEAAG